MQPSDWVLAGNVVTILSHFAQFTNEISKRDTSIADIWPLIHGLKSVLLDLQEELEKQNVTGLLNDLHSELVRRFPLFDSKANILATVLDPRYKTSFFDDGNTLTKCRELISEEISLIVPASSSKKSQNCDDENDDECETVTENQQRSLLQVSNKI